MNIIKELYYGNIIGEETRCSPQVRKLRRLQEVEYKKLQEKLSTDDMAIVDKYIDINIDAYSEELVDSYVRGFKTGVLIGVESSNIKYNN